MRWAVLGGDAPEAHKQFRDCIFHFRRTGLCVAEAQFESNMTPTPETVALSFTRPGSEFNNEPGGGYYYDGYHVVPRNKRITVPKNMQRAEYLVVSLTIDQAYSNWAVNGYTVVYEDGSERGTV